jgi:hypothetical protein
MKKLFSFLLVVILLIPVFSFSSASEADVNFSPSHYSLFIDGKYVPGARGNPFSFDLLFVDIYFNESPDKAYVCISKRFSGIFITSGMVSVSVAESDGVVYFAYPDGSFLTGSWDEDGESLWLNTEGTSFRLHQIPKFNYSEDWK